MSNPNDALLGAKIRKLCDGGPFDLTDSPKSMVDAVVRLCAETDASKPEPLPEGCAAVQSGPCVAGECVCKPEPQAQRSVTKAEDAILHRALMRLVKVVKPEPQAQAGQIPDAVEHYGRVFDPRAGEHFPQAQAGEPETVAWLYYHSRMEEPLDVDLNKPQMSATLPGDVYWEKPLVTLQAHREAMAEARSQVEFLDASIAKKDAALRACVEALNVVDANNESYVGERTVAAAITQAQEAMK